MGPSLIAATFEVIEPEIVFELSVLLFDGPTTPRERDEVDQRRMWRQMQQIVFALVNRRAFAEKPALASSLRRADPQGDEACGERAARARAPGDRLPRVVGRRGRERGGGVRPRHL